ncbi:MAG: XdhC family protein [Salinibacterium sp.]|nr:XdhC family protein [Salinibacterium sp.]
MFEIADRLLAAVDAGRVLVVATAISIEGSAPRTVGTSMAWDGEAVIGSIAGGCVEGAVVEACEAVLAGAPAHTVEYGVSDETAFAVGLTCGGIIRVHVQPFTPELEAGLREGRDLEVCRDFSERPPVESRMIIFGAMEFSTALAAAARVMGYRVTVVDPRPLFATAERFPGVETVVVWPTEYLASTTIDERTVICVLSHDARFDAELIAQALALPVAYVGAMGSRATHDRRIASLLERGVTPAALAALHSPIGLDLGASTPQETAISILAEVLAARTDTTALPLTVLDGAIHTRRSVRA